MVLTVVVERGEEEEDLSHGNNVNNEIARDSTYL